MAASQKSEDKARFFADLERLGDSSSDAETVSDRELTILASRRQRSHANRSLQRGLGNSGNIGTKHLYKYVDQASTPKQSIQHETNPSTVALSKPTPEIVDLTTPTGPSDPTSSTASLSVVPCSKISTKRPLADRATTSTSTPKRSRKSKVEISLVPEEQRIFKNLVFYFVPNDQIVKHRKLRIQRAQEYGAQWVAKFDSSVSHIIVEPDIDYIEVAKAFPEKRVPQHVTIVKNTWFSESIRSGFTRDESQSRFRLLKAPVTSNVRILPRIASPVTPRSQAHTKQTDTPSRSDFTSPQTADEFEKILAQVRDFGAFPLDLETAMSVSSEIAESSFGSTSSMEVTNNKSSDLQENKGYQCMKSHDGKSDNNPNSRTIDILQEMATYYDRTGDHWRTTAYRKAIAALRQQRVLIATREQGLTIPQIGTRLADKIEEIVATNRLRRLESTKDDPDAQVLQLFMGIYDVGLKQATQWIGQGHRTLADLRAKVELSHNQRIGIEHYDDFQQRVPRAEVSKHALVVERACRAVDKDMQVTVGGSYRRGDPDSGDIDLIITKPNADMSHIRTLLNTHIIPALTKAGFLKCALASSHRNGSKWHGASCLPGSKTWRRIDLLFVPWAELGAALLYFTGNDIFNRSIRLLASRKGMRLNQHGLYKDVMRGEGRVKMTEGTLVEGHDEKRIFEILGVPWREPHERKC